MKITMDTSTYAQASELIRQWWTQGYDDSNTAFVAHSYGVDFKAGESLHQLALRVVLEDKHT